MRKSLKDKENLILLSEPRFSLKNVDKNKKKIEMTEGRMSMLPLKRQRLSIAMQKPNQQHSSSVLKNNMNILNNSAINMSPLMRSNQKQIRKETIINNLVNKLDEEEQIRSIIQTKLKKNSYRGVGKQLMSTSQFQPYFSNNYMQNTQPNPITSQSKQLNLVTGINDQNQTYLASKLQKCQEQLRHFKQIIELMSIKMKMMEDEKQKHKNQNDEIKGDQNITCRNCKCTKNSNQKQRRTKKMKDSSTQTIRQISHFNEDQTDHDYDYELINHSNKFNFDFLQNLDKTIKVLNSNKKIR